MATCGRKRKSVDTEDVKVLLSNKKFQSPLVITATDGRTSIKTKSRLPLFETNGGLDDDQIKQQFLSRISQAESLLNQKRVSTQNSILQTLCKPGYTTPRKHNHGVTTPNPFSFMTPDITRRRRNSVSGRRDSMCGRRVSLSGKKPSQDERQLLCTQMKSRLPMSGRKMKLQASLQLRMLESQELQASRVAQARRELWMDRQERAYSVWLNNLLKEPMDVNAKVLAVGRGLEMRASVESLRKSSAGFGVAIGSLSFDKENQSSCLSNALPDTHQTSKQNRRVLSKLQLSGGVLENKAADSFEAIQPNLSQICTASELRRRVNPYMEPTKCERLVSTMIQLTKIIDDGRLRMKPDCIILSDVALRQKALNVLFSYTPAWLWLGLAIVLGPIALPDRHFPDENVTGQEGEKHTENAFLEALIEEHFFADSTLAKKYATNRSIDGLYRDGFKEALGKLILKRIFLLILVLDKMKCETALKSAHGIDGIDGGSPLLFQPDGKVKSSRQALEEFLSNVMQGEGDLIVHVGKLGYHVSYVQAPLCEYNFEVKNLVEDLQDGIYLCRLAQLMSHDLSILAKVKLPCHLPKKRVHNCKLALESLGQAGVSLQDEQGAPITAEQLASGQREKTLSLMWNVIIHLQIPRLVSHPKLFQEFERAGLAANPEATGEAVLDRLLNWVQTICSQVGGPPVQNFSTSFADGQVLCYLISNYLPQCLPHHTIKCTTIPASNLPDEQTNGHHGIWELHSLQGSCDISPGDYDAIAHNFRLVEEVAQMLGIASEVLQLSDVVDGDLCTSERNIIIFVAHLCSALLNADPQALRFSKSIVPVLSRESSESSIGNYPQLTKLNSQATASPGDYATVESAVITIQAWYKGQWQRRSFKSLKKNVITIQLFVRWWLTEKRSKNESKILKSKESSEGLADNSLELLSVDFEVLLKHVTRLQGIFRTLKLRKAFLVQRQRARTIQQYWRAYRTRKDELKTIRAVLTIQSCWRGFSARRAFKRGVLAAVQIQSHVRGFLHQRKFKTCMIQIVRVQALVRGGSVRRQLRTSRESAIKIQAVWRGFLVKKLFRIWRCAALLLQRHARGYLQRKKYQSNRVRLLRIQAFVRAHLLRKRLQEMRRSALRIQSTWRGTLVRKSIQDENMAATHIQTWVRGYLQRKVYQLEKNHIIQLQASIRCNLAQKRLRLLIQGVMLIQACWRGFCSRKMVQKWRTAATHIQRFYQGWHKRMAYQSTRNSAIQIQALARGYLVRSHAEKHNRAVTQIQAGWRGLCVRRSLQKSNLAATIIQSFYRCYVQRKVYHEQRMAIVKIQGIVRARHEPHMIRLRSGNQKPTHLMNAAASIVQAYWRGHCVKKTTAVPASQQNAEQYENGCDLEEQGRWIQVYTLSELKAGQILTSWAKKLQYRLNFLRLQRVALFIQRVFRGQKARKNVAHIKRCISRIQAHWRGHKWRTGQSRVKMHMQELRLRMQSTAATVDNSQRLGNRLTEALAQLLSQKTVSGILNTCATIDIATEHSKQCCERLAEGGAIKKLLQLIQTTNRSPPHEQVLKHALSILANLARFPDLAFSIASELDSINIIVEQIMIFRNKEEVFSKAMKVLQHVSCTPGCAAIIQKDIVVMRRLQNVALTLERKCEVEKRNLEKLPQSTQPPLRKAAERKLKEITQHHQSIMSILPGKAPRKPTLSVPPSQISGVRKPPPTPHVLGFRRNDLCMSSSASITKSSEHCRRDGLTSTTNPIHAKDTDEKIRDSLIIASASRSKNGTVDWRESISVRPPWGASLHVNTPIPETPEATSERSKSATKPASAVINLSNDGQQLVSCTTSMKNVDERRKQPILSKPIRHRGAMGGSKDLSDVRQSQSRVPRVPLKDRSNYGTKNVQS